METTTQRAGNFQETLPKTPALERKCEGGYFAVKVYSARLGTHIYVVPDFEALKALRAIEGNGEAAYTGDEIKSLYGVSGEHLEAVHAVKEAFPLAQIIETRRTEENV